MKDKSGSEDHQSLDVEALEGLDFGPNWDQPNKTAHTREFSEGPRRSHQRERRGASADRGKIERGEIGREIQMQPEEQVSRELRNDAGRRCRIIPWI